MANYPPTLPGISEAATDALIASLQAGLDQLNAILSHDDLTPISRDLVNSDIKRGDSDSLPDVALQPLWISVQPGSKSDGLTLEADLTTFGESDWHGYVNNYFAVITAYIHPKAAFNPDADTHVAIRSRVLERISDWARRDVFNNQAALLITLGSQEYSTLSGETFDQLKAGKVKEIYQGLVPKSAGAMIWVPAVQLQFEGMIG